MQRSEQHSLPAALSAALLAAALTLGAPRPAMLAARADAEAGVSPSEKRRLAVERRKEMLAKACAGWFACSAPLMDAQDFHLTLK